MERTVSMLWMCEDNREILKTTSCTARRWVAQWVAGRQFDCGQHSLGGWNSQSQRSFYTRQNCWTYAICRMWMVNHTDHHSRCVVVTKTQLSVGTSHFDWWPHHKVHGCVLTISDSLPQARWEHTGSGNYRGYEMCVHCYIPPSKQASRHCVKKCECSRVKVKTETSVNKCMAAVF